MHKNHQADSLSMSFSENTEPIIDIYFHQSKNDGIFLINGFFIRRIMPILMINCFNWCLHCCFVWRCFFTCILVSANGNSCVLMLTHLLKKKLFACMTRASQGSHMNAYTTCVHMKLVLVAYWKWEQEGGIVIFVWERGKHRCFVYIQTTSIDNLL